MSKYTKQQFQALRDEGYNQREIADKFGTTQSVVSKVLSGYNQRPEVKAYWQRPEVKARQKAYYQRPEVKERYRQTRIPARIKRLEAKLKELKNK